MKKRDLRRYFTQKYVFSYMLAMLLLFLLIEPGVAASGARFGLMLWAERLLPSLLPFMIITQLLIRSGYLDAIMKKLHIRHAWFVLFAGTLFGFPMGCKLTADLYEHGYLNPKEAKLLFVLSNQMSPAFVGGYILSETLGLERLIPVTYLIFYVPSVCYGFFRLRRSTASTNRCAETVYKAKKSTSGSHISIAILDAGIMNSFETMLKLGGYVMLFSIITNMCRYFLSAFPACCTFIAGLLEVTGAVNAINDYFSDVRLKYIAVLAATAFGGCSGIAQTASLIQPAGEKTVNAPFSIAAYIRGRLMVAAVTTLLATLTVPFLKL